MVGAIGEMCVYCGEELATTRILNPNFDDNDTYWFVCQTCKMAIISQQKLTMGMTIMHRENGDDVKKGFAQKIIDEATKELNDLHEKTGKAMLSVEFTKKETSPPKDKKWKIVFTDSVLKQMDTLPDDEYIELSEGIKEFVNNVSSGKIDPAVVGEKVDMEQLKIEEPDVYEMLMKGVEEARRKVKDDGK
jgi:hypothetical protein